MTDFLCWKARFIDLKLLLPLNNLPCYISCWTWSGEEKHQDSNERKSTDKSLIVSHSVSMLDFLPFCFSFTFYSLPKKKVLRGKNFVDSKVGCKGRFLSHKLWSFINRKWSETLQWLNKNVIHIPCWWLSSSEIWEFIKKHKFESVQCNIFIFQETFL